MPQELSDPSDSGPDASTVALFQQDWEIYRKMVDNNFLFHREAYGCLHAFLTREITRPFVFLDIACGDASASARALRGTAISRYHGIDFSAAALDLARQNLTTLKCRVTLEQADFMTALSGREHRDDVIFIGLSLHHLESAEKLAFMFQVRRALAPGGVFIIYENTSPDGEDRADWLRRWDAQQPAWTAYTPDEWSAMRTHVHAADYPETVTGWHQLGRYAGFGQTRELYAAPTDLFRMFAFAG